MSRIVVIGGGFAGLSAALVAVDETERNGGDVAVTLVSPSPYITIRPRLYEPHPERLREPLAPILDPVGVAFVEGGVEEISVAERCVAVAKVDGQSVTLEYDKLVLATGSALVHQNIPGAEHAFNIDTFEAADAFDQHLRTLPTTSETFVIVGAGLTGIELATEMRGRIAIHHGNTAADDARIVLVDRNAEVGTGFGEEAQTHIVSALDNASVELVLNTGISEIAVDGVTLDDGTKLATQTTVLTVGQRANVLTEQIPGERDSQGRLYVSDALQVPGAEDIYAAGDVAHALVDGEHPAMMACQHSRTMGKYAGFNAARSLLGLPERAYRQPIYVTCLDLGASGAVFTTGWERRLEITGEAAKDRKRLINTELIYPPTGSRDEILAAIRIDEKTGR